MTVKITAERLLIAVPIISTILRERRAMPQRGKLLFALMHTALLPKWNTINNQRDELIKEYDFHPLIKRVATPEDGKEAMQRGWAEEPSKEFGVPADKQADFEAKWRPLGDTEIEVDVNPIPLKVFDLGLMSDGSIEGSEIIDMAGLIAE